MTPSPKPSAELKRLLEEMAAQIENRITFPLSYMEERGILRYIHSLEEQNRGMREALETASVHSNPVLIGEAILKGLSFARPTDTPHSL